MAEVDRERERSRERSVAQRVSVLCALTLLLWTPVDSAARFLRRRIGGVNVILHSDKRHRMHSQPSSQHILRLFTHSHTHTGCRQALQELLLFLLWPKRHLLASETRPSLCVCVWVYS